MANPQLSLSPSQPLKKVSIPWVIRSLIESGLNPAHPAMIKAHGALFRFYLGGFRPMEVGY